MTTKRLTSEELDHYMQAGRIAQRIREEFKGRIKDGKKILEYCEELETSVLSSGASLAFPCNIGINQVAAHFTPDFSDEMAFGPMDLVKVDYGLHIDGCIADAAFTVPLSTADSKLVGTADLALREVVSALRAGDKISKVGGIVGPIAGRNSFKIIENLQGHGIDRYRLHSGISIPNVPNYDMRRLQENSIVAIEPFLTYGFGAGRVDETSTVNILQLPADSKAVPRELSRAFDYLPFCNRWLRRLSLSIPPSIEGRTHRYPVLAEANGAPVAQAETTLILLEDRTIDLIP